MSARLELIHVSHTTIHTTRHNAREDLPARGGSMGMYHASEAAADVKMYPYKFSNKNTL